MTERARCVDYLYDNELLMYYRLYGCQPGALPIHSDKLKNTPEYAFNLLTIQSPALLKELSRATDWRYPQV